MPNHIKDRRNRPLNDLRISLTDRCQFRCNYCLPAEHIDVMRQQQHNYLSFSEIVQVAKSFATLGVNKIRLTGGEPLLRKNLPELIQQLKCITSINDVAMTTNGALLAPVLDDLIAAGLDRITISLDAIDPQLFQSITGTHQNVNEIIDVILQSSQSSLKTVKVNCVLQKGVNENQILPVLEMFKQSRVEVRFIEFMDVGTINGWEVDEVITTETTLLKIKESFAVSPITEKSASDVAQRYRLNNGESTFGTISSISKPFCQNCNRARVSANGRIFTCLFSQQGHDIRPLIHTPELLEKKIQDIWQQRKDQYSMQRKLNKKHQSNKIEMFIMGG